MGVNPIGGSEASSVLTGFVAGPAEFTSGTEMVQKKNTTGKSPANQQNAKGGIK